MLEDRVVPSGKGDYMYIASFATNSVERYQELRWAPKPADGQTGATFVKAGVGGSGNDLHFPLGLLVEPQHPGRLLVTSLLTDEVLEYNVKTGAFVKAFITAQSGGLSGPAGILYGPDGMIYLASVDNAEVLRYNAMTGAFIDVYAQLNTMGITGMVFGPDGALYACTRFSNSVVRITNGGTTVETFVQPGDGGLSRAGGLVFGPDGNLYVTSEDTNNVLRFDGQSGAFMDEFVKSGSGGLLRPSGLLFGPFGDLYVDSADNNLVLHYDGQTGAFLNVIASQHDDQVLSGPRGILFTQTDPTTLAYNGQPNDTQGGFQVGTFSISSATNLSGTVGMGNSAPVLSARTVTGNAQDTETIGTASGSAAPLSDLVYAGPDNLASVAGLESALDQTFLVS
jgi:WD40 repeat protein